MSIDEIIANVKTEIQFGLWQLEFFADDVADALEPIMPEFMVEDRKKKKAEDAARLENHYKEEERERMRDYAKSQRKNMLFQEEAHSLYQKVQRIFWTGSISEETKKSIFYDIIKEMEKNLITANDKHAVLAEPENKDLKKSEKNTELNYNGISEEEACFLYQKIQQIFETNSISEEAKEVIFYDLTKEMERNFVVANVGLVLPAETADEELMECEENTDVEKELNQKENDIDPQEAVHALHKKIQEVFRADGISKETKEVILYDIVERLENGHALYKKIQQAFQADGISEKTKELILYDIVKELEKN